MAEADQGVGQREPGRVGVDPGRQRVVELDQVRPQPQDVGEAGVARAGVVHRQPDSGGAEAVELGQRRLRLPRPVVLGDLQDQPAGRAGQHLGRQLLGQPARADQPRGSVQAQVHRVGQPVEIGQRPPDRGQLKLQVQPDQGRLREPHLGVGVGDGQDPVHLVRPPATRPTRPT